MGVEKLQQQREPVPPASTPQQFIPKPLDQLMQCCPLQRPGENSTLIFAMVDHFPTFGKMVARPEPLSQQTLEPPAAPNILPKNGLEPQRIKIRTADGTVHRKSPREATKRDMPGEESHDSLDAIGRQACQGNRGREIDNQHPGLKPRGILPDRKCKSLPVGN